MPNHVHVVAQLASEISLAKVLLSWKSYTARRANAILGRSGVFWQREYFDRIIRGAARRSESSGGSQAKLLRPPPLPRHGEDGGPE
jgi:transposase IS200 family protein